MALAVVAMSWLVPHHDACPADNGADVANPEDELIENAPPVWWDCAESEQWLRSFTRARADVAFTEEELVEAARRKYLGNVPEGGAKTEQQAQHELKYVLVHALVRSAYAVDAEPAQARRVWADFRRRCERSHNSYELLRWLTIRAGADPFDMWRYLP